MIGLESGLSIRTGLIMKRRVMKKNLFGRKANGVQRFDKKPEEKGATPKE